MARKVRRFSRCLRFFVYGLIFLLVIAGIAVRFGPYTFDDVAEVTMPHRDLENDAASTKEKYQPKPKPVIDAQEKLRLEAIKQHTDSRGRIVFGPTAVVEMKIDPKLEKGIIWPAHYKIIPLDQVEVTYTEEQFQKDRENWYQNFFIAGYESNGDRDPQWDHLVIEFLTEAARRVSITRYERHRSPKFFDDRFDDNIVEQARKIIELGCKDNLVTALFVEELRRQKNVDAKRISDLLVNSFDADRYSEFINYQIVRILSLTGQGVHLREKMTHHFRNAINGKQLSPLERRIYFEEAQTIMSPVNSSILGQFIVSIECQEQADPWLKNMIVGDFYNKMALNGFFTRQFWPSYNIVVNNSMKNAKSVHMGHLRKAYRLYLQAYEIAPALPEVHLRLFRMSSSQHPTGTILDRISETEGALDHLSPASSRFWFDKAVAAQFDYRPIYRLYRAGLLPIQNGNYNWARYSGLFEFGLECVNSKQFKTQIPFGYHDALQAIIRHDEYSKPPDSPRNREIYAVEKILPPFKKMIEGYSEHFTTEQKHYYQSMLAGINWIQNHREIAVKHYKELHSSLDRNAMFELYMNSIEFERYLAGRTDKAEMAFDPDEILEISFIPNQPHLLLSLTEGRFSTWDLKTEQTINDYSLMSGENGVPIQSSISTGAKFVSCYRHPMLKVFDTDSFSQIASLTFPEQLKTHVVSGSGRYVGVAVGERVEVWETATQKKVAEINIHEEKTMWGQYDWRNHIQRVRHIIFSENDSYVAFIRGDLFSKFSQNIYWSPENASNLVDRLYVWDIRKKELIYKNTPFFPNINSVRFTEGKEELWVSGTDWSTYQENNNSFLVIREAHSIKLIDPRSNKTLRKYDGRNRALWAPKEYGKDSSLLVAMGGRELLVWDTNSSEEITSAHLHDHTVRHMVSSRKLNQIVTIDTKGMVNILSQKLRPNHRLILTEPDYYENQSPQRIGFDIKSNRIAICNEKTGGIIWDFSNPKRVTGHAYRSSGPVGTTAFDFSPDLKLLATTADRMPGDAIRKLQEKSPVSIWDTTTGKVVRILQGGTSFVESARFDPTGRFIAVGFRDGNLMIWDLQSHSKQPVQMLKEHVAAVTQLNFSLDGQFLVSGGQAGESFGKKVMPSIKIWKTTGQGSEYKLIRTLEIKHRTTHPFGIQSIDISPDGKWLLASYQFNTYLFSFEGDLRCTVSGNKAQFLPDSSKFITAGGVKLNKTVAMWDLDGHKIKEFQGGHRRPISTLALFPGKPIFLSASFSEGIAAWHADSEKQIIFLRNLFK